jgi:hypothetical protein
MAHTYVVATNTAIGDTATLTGSVDGIPVTIQYYLSALQGMTLGQAKTFVANLMLQAAIPNAPISVASVTNLPIGTFTQ